MKKYRALKSVEMLPSPEISITIDYEQIIKAFQDLRYIGELKQRWDEIKKLINGINKKLLE